MGDFEKLKDIGVEAIYQRTYIAHQNIEFILDKDFAKLNNKFKATGFITMLEKEFGLDLSDFKKEAEKFFDHKESEKQKVMASEKEPKEIDKRFIIYPVAIVSILLVLSLIMGDSSSDVEETQTIVKENIQATNNPPEVAIDKPVENAPIQEDIKAVAGQTTPSVTVPEQKQEEIKQEIKPEPKTEVVVEQKPKVEQPIVKEEPKVEAPKIPATSLPKIKITPAAQIWVGVIYLDDYSKKDYLSTKTFELDNTRDQLILTGHGRLTINVGDKEQVHTDENRLRFLYQNGEFKMINMEIFREMNNGKNW
jgi:hypothetical protein